MREGVRHPLAVLAVQAAACWPVWPWYIARLRDGSDEPWCALAFVAAIVLALRGGKRVDRIESFTLPVFWMSAYAASVMFLPMIFSAAIAFLAVGSTIHYWRHGRFFSAGVWGLFVLGTPLLASLQFYLGYPLRVLVGYMASPLLQISGFNVAVEGTLLNWGGHLVEIDAPCSGIRMLWAGLFLTALLCTAYKLTTTRTLACTALAVFGVVKANAFRAAALFFIEASIIPFPAWGHSAVGVVLFATTALFIIGVCDRFKEQAA